VKQESPHEEEVAPWHKVIQPTCGAHGPAEHQICEVVRVTTEAPPARRNEQGMMCFAISGAVLAFDVFSGLAPNCGGAISAADQVFLVVAAAKKCIARETDGQDQGGLDIGQVYRIATEILYLEGVHCSGSAMYHMTMVMASSRKLLLTCWTQMLAKAYCLARTRCHPRRE
jgi:hypothetical protein